MVLIMYGPIYILILMPDYILFTSYTWVVSPVSTYTMYREDSFSAKYSKLLI